MGGTRAISERGVETALAMKVRAARQRKISGQALAYE